MSVLPGLFDWPEIGMRLNYKSSMTLGPNYVDLRSPTNRIPIGKGVGKGHFTPSCVC